MRAAMCGTVCAAVVASCAEDDALREVQWPEVSSEYRVTVEPTRVEAEPCTATCGCEGTRLEYTGTQHIAATIPLDYTDAPPAGGNHDPCWAAWGVHAEPVPQRNFVHNLEHGGVVLLHDCDCDTGALEALAGALGPNVLVTPYPGLERPFAALAWGHRLLLDCLDEDALRAFYTQHQNQAPEKTAAMPPGSCM